MVDANIGGMAQSARLSIFLTKMRGAFLLAVALEDERVQQRWSLVDAFMKGQRAKTCGSVPEMCEIMRY